MKGPLFASAGINANDADPALIIQDFLTNAQYGVLFPAASIDAATLLDSLRSSAVTITIAAPAVVTWTAHGLSNGQGVIFSTTGLLPTGLTPGTIYYVVAAVTNTFEVAATPGGTPINTSGSQSGTHTAKTVGSSYQAYCKASHLAMSPVLANQEAANSILARWLKLTNSAAVWSGGKLKFIPYGDTPVTGNLYPSGTYTFNPNVTPLYNLADDDFIHEDGKGPIEVIRSDPYATYNWQRLQISQRFSIVGTSYNTAPIDAFDQNAIELYGLRRASDITANEICDPFVGQVSAQLILQRGLYIRNTYTFKLSFEYCLLEPMDLVTVTDTALGLTNIAIRVTAIEEDDAGLLSVTAEEFPGGTATAVQYPVQGNMGTPPNQAVVPARVNAPVIFEPSEALTGGVAQVIAAVSGGIAPVYLLAEDSSTGQHKTKQGNVTPVIASLTTVLFSVYAQAVARSALRLAFFNGAANIGCDFDLTAGTTGTPDAGITATITPAGGNWFQCVITGAMVATAAATLTIQLENPIGTISYAGTLGNGIYIWGGAVSFGGTGPTFLPAFASVTGAALATSGTSTPEGASGIADPNWGGAFVWLSTDGNTYGNIGTVLAPARQGFLTAALPFPSGGNPDVTNTLSVSLTESGGALASGTASDAANGVTLCLVDNELLAYATATLAGTNAYNLTYLFRALYGTSPAAHSSGAPFARIDTAIFKYPLPPALIGVPLSLKFQSFNIFGQAVEDLSECTVYTYTPSGAGQLSGPVTKALIAGASLDFGLVTAMVSEMDQWGTITDGFTLAFVDLGSRIP
ncbi:MAG: phage tail protein [Methylocella sp.]